MTMPAWATGPTESFYVQVGDIGVSQSWVVTPRGTAPLVGSQWWAVNRSAYTQHIPVWAVVLAVVFFPIGLLFLLAKETRLSAWIEVTVQSGNLFHQTAVPHDSPGAMEVLGKVEYLNNLARPAPVD
jgi:hypothetical protein